ncbi:hypothetical protein DEM27_22210 [Metarhizobium album]|uniref:Uncharacterized protein n=1 Tax=Metarhizobium album TaxID=2182425 RepID=A0A2U2DL54_9HYPH|nr:hypothetical protein [Rhizobium album]PWE54034.1 hypothetical protein DEM27_22210 [Rhizobium album]
MADETTSSIIHIADLDKLYEEICAGKGLSLNSEAAKALHVLLLQLHSQGVHEKAKLEEAGRHFP